ncbi:metallophosphoesterase family protein [Nocardioides caldifontis]|uniref:metallophosphoesterase family protein n=1 Tax=Nocardioides caldifontis TaxID=2588938 RepID=UPI0011DF86DC|nr:metallophosphoesterase [Nocardioides caldifontis]
MSWSRRRGPAVLGAVLALAATPAASHPVTSEAPPPAAVERPKRPEVVRVVAVGDIACAPGSTVTETRCRHEETSDLARRLQPHRVLALGDLQYPIGSLTAFQKSYGPTWGRLRSITHPVLGNHEYQTTDALGYYRYFRNRQPGPPGYYTRKYGTWRVFVLNSNCGYIDCARQRQWFKQGLKKHRSRCTLVAMHHPRYTSSLGATLGKGVAKLAGVAYRRGVDLVLSGHEHSYERFRKLDARGRRAKDGFVQLVVGSGGASHRELVGPATGSEYQDDENFGVLRLSLRDGGYGFAFVTLDGERPDRGKGRCV